MAAKQGVFDRGDLSRDFSDVEVFLRAWQSAGHLMLARGVA